VLLHDIHDGIRIVVFSGYVQDFLGAFKALMEDLETFTSAFPDLNRSHEAVTAAFPVSGSCFVDMKGKKAFPAMVTAGFRCLRVICATVFATERFINGDWLFAGLNNHAFYDIINR
jgi:hypothetical protein